MSFSSASRARPIDLSKRHELLRVGRWSLGLLAASFAGPSAANPSWASQAKASAHAAPGPVLIMRHAQTEPGVGDPPEFQLGQCNTQRNLVAEGRAQAQALGEQLAKLGLVPAAIRSSRWCRCEQTASLIAKGLSATQTMKVEAWPALDSVFVARDRAAPQSSILHERLLQLSQMAASNPSHFELWVTHGANVMALAGVSPMALQAHWLSMSASKKLGAPPDVKPFTTA